MGGQAQGGRSTGSRTEQGDRQRSKTPGSSVCKSAFHLKGLGTFRGFQRKGTGTGHNPRNILDPSKLFVGARQERGRPVPRVLRSTLSQGWWPGPASGSEDGETGDGQIFRRENWKN